MFMVCLKSMQVESKTGLLENTVCFFHVVCPISSCGLGPACTGSPPSRSSGLAHRGRDSEAEPLRRRCASFWNPQALPLTCAPPLNAGLGVPREGQAPQTVQALGHRPV